MIFKKGISVFPRMRSTVKHFLGFMFWVPKDAELARHQVKRMEKKITNHDELIDHCEELFERDILPEDFQWEFFVQEDYKDDKSLIIMKAHHGFTDGMGAIFLFSFMNTNWSEMILPRMVKPNWVKLLIVQLMFPILAFRYFQLNFRARAAKQPHPLKNVKITKKISMAECGPFNFDQLKFYKKLKITFNHYILGVVGLALQKEYEKLGCSVEHVVGSFPVNVRVPTPNIEEVELKNNIAGVSFELPLLKSMSEVKKVKTAID